MPRTVTDLKTYQELSRGKVDFLGLGPHIICWLGNQPVYVSTISPLVVCALEDNGKPTRKGESRYSLRRLEGVTEDQLTPVG